MKTLIIGDIHGRRFWKRPVEKYINKVDKIVFLGDYFDAYQDEGRGARGHSRSGREPAGGDNGGRKHTSGGKPERMS